MKITFIGGGNMATALIGGMIKRGFNASQIQGTRSKYGRGLHPYWRLRQGARR